MRTKQTRIHRETSKPLKRGNVKINKIFGADVIIPTFMRPENVAKVIDNIGSDPSIDILFVAHESDNETIEEIRKTGRRFITYQQRSTAVAAANVGYEYLLKGSRRKYVVLSQDDIYHHDGWLPKAINCAEINGAKIVGLYDGFEGHAQTQHSVSWLINRKFFKENSLVEGYPFKVFCPEYVKNYADNELNEYSKAKGWFVFCKESLTEHKHPGLGTGENHPRYAFGDRMAQQDQETFLRRKQLWR